MVTVVENLQSCMEINPIPVAARFMVWVCGRSLAGTVGSNPARAWIFVSCECCV
jgi:hypothetical protein